MRARKNPRTNLYPHCMRSMTVLALVSTSVLGCAAERPSISCKAQKANRSDDAVRCFARQSANALSASMSPFSRTPLPILQLHGHSSSDGETIS